MASNISNFEQRSDRSREFKSRKRRKIENAGSQYQSSNDRREIKWRSPAKQTAYSSKLVEALRHVRRPSFPASNVFTRSRAVRDAADKVLAIAARGRSRWSRAVLANRLKLQLRNHKKANSPNKSKLKAPAGSSRLKIPVTGAADTQRLPPLQRRVHVLSRLVPGCRNLSFPNLLEETTDYIAALEMQVRAMSAVAELLAGAGASADSTDRRDMT